MKLAPIKILGLLLAASLYGGRVEAGCDIETFSGATEIGGGLNLIVDGDLPNNSVFRSVDNGFGNGSPSLRCDADYQVEIQSDVLVNGVPSSNPVRELLLEDGTPTGVGLRFRFTDQDRVTSAVPYRRTVTFPRSASYQFWQSGVQWDYVKLRNDIRYGKVRQERVAHTRDMSGVLPSTWPTLRRVRIGDLAFVSPSCTIDDGDLFREVKLGHYSVADFENQAESTWVPFHFTVTSCNNPAERFADITFGVGNDADLNNSALFSMNAGGPGGLGIAIQTDDGTNAVMAPGETRAFADPIENKQYAFRARLERTVGAVTPGTINRQVNVRITFR